MRFRPGIAPILPLRAFCGTHNPFQLSRISLLKRSECLTSEEVGTGSLALVSQNRGIVVIRYIVNVWRHALIPTLKDGVSALLRR